MFYLVLLISSIACLIHSASAHTCTSSQECTAVSLARDSLLVRCVEGTCDCDNFCFEFDAFVTGDIQDSCTVRSECYSYLKQNDTCILITKPIKDIALYAVFLGFVGVANFQVGLTTQGAFQAVLFTLLVVASVLDCLVNARCYYKRKRGHSGHGIVFLWNVVLFIIILLLSLTLFFWWLLDLILFASSTKRDSNGCLLS